MSKPVLYTSLTVLLCGAIALYYFLDPVDYKWMPKCPTKMMFGIDCPGCGFQRAAHAFLHGRFKEAIGYNLFFFVAFPYLIMVMSCGLLREGKLRTKLTHLVEGKWMTHGYVALFFIWFILRNILDM